MAIPSILEKFSVTIDGQGLFGIAERVALPDLELVTVEHRAGGMDFPIDIEVGMAKLNIELDISGYDSKIAGLWGVTKGKNVPLIIRGALDTDGNVQPMSIVCIGLITKSSMGELKPGEKNMLKLMMNLRYYKVDVAGKIIHEIDSQTMTRTVNGVDQLSDYRSALGIG